MPSDESPAQTEIEEAVLGACLLHLGGVDTALTLGITRMAFVLPGYQAIWRALEQWHAAPQTNDDIVDPLLLWEHVRRNGDEGKLAGFSDIVTLLTRASQGDVRRLRARCLALREWELRRGTWRAAHKLLKLAPDPQVGLGEMSDLLDGTLGELQGDGAESFTTTEQAGDDLYRYIEAQRGHEGPLGLSTGFVDWDNMTDGFEPGDHIILAARPSEGKSALAWQIAEHVAERHGPVAMFSLEMGPRPLMLRALARMTMLRTKDIARGMVTDEQKRRVTEALARLQCLPLHLDTRGSVSTAQLRARARLLHRRTPLKLIIVDYLQLVHAQAEKREQEVALVSRSLKSLGMELEVPVLSCCQMSRGNEYRSGKDKRPRLSDLRDSGQIEQDADVVAFLYHGYRHQDGDDGTVELIVAKHRDGPTGSVFLHWDPEHAAFASRTNVHVWQAAS